jgi:hypothetical protein
MTTRVRQAIHQSITDIMAVAAADVMDTDKAECSISRILPVRHPRYRDNNTYAHALALSGLPVYVASSHSLHSLPLCIPDLTADRRHNGGELS